MSDIMWGNVRETNRKAAQPAVGETTRAVGKRARRSIVRKAIPAIREARMSGVAGGDGIWGMGENGPGFARVPAGVPAYVLESGVRQTQYYMEESPDTRNHRSQGKTDRPGTGAGQREKVSDGEQVVQLQNIKADTQLFRYTNVQGVLKPGGKETILCFESMGNELSQCDEIFRETTKYDGSTILTFGLNAEGNVGNGGSLGDLINKITEWPNHFKEQVRNENDRHLLLAKEDANKIAINPKGGFHALYVFPFIWNEPQGNDDTYYRMPYMEARLEVMRRAQDIVDKELGLQKAPVLFRWIDADARDDTSNDIPEETLLNMAMDEKARIMTGYYNWRSDSNNEDMENSKNIGKNYNKGTQEQIKNVEAYHSFIQRLNEAEKAVRSCYHSLARKRRNESVAQPSSGDTSQQPQQSAPQQEETPKERYAKGFGSYLHPSSSGYLPGYYLPEPTLVMNRTAHGAMLREFREYDWQNYKQDKESMKLIDHLLTVLGVPKDAPTIDELIRYEEKLSVSKPLKFEFVSGSYLGTEFPKLFKNGSLTMHNLYSALNNLRQSAFSDWFFVGGQKWKNWENGGEQSAETEDQEMQKVLNGEKNNQSNLLFVFLNEKEGKPTKYDRVKAYWLSQAAKPEARKAEETRKAEEAKEAPAAQATKKKKK